METAENWVSLREFARHRDVTLAAVQKAVSSGRVTAVRRDGKGHLASIEMNRATIEWNGNTDLDQAARNGKFLSPPGIPAAVPVSAPWTGPAMASATESNPMAGAVTDAAGPHVVASKGPGDGDNVAGDAPGGQAKLGLDPSGGRVDHGVGYYAARGRREEAEARQAELDLLEREGKLVPVDEIEATWTRFVIAARTFALQLRWTLPEEMEAAESIEQKRAILDAAMEKFLRKLVAYEDSDSEPEAGDVVLRAAGEDHGGGVGAPQARAVGEEQREAGRI